MTSTTSTAQMATWKPRRWNSHNPNEYETKLQAMDVAKLERECEQMVWLSAFAGNNPRSDYHWMVDACYAECVRRDDTSIYQRGWNRAAGEAG